jgi:endonuclease YncB( thermonuclease family)
MNALYGINAPESRHAERQASVAYVKTTLIGPGVAVKVRTFRDPLDKYGRWLADVYRASDGLWLNNAMLVRGHGVVSKPEGAATN